MATIRQRRSVYETKKEAKLGASGLTIQPPRTAGSPRPRQLVDERKGVNTSGWAALTPRDQTSGAMQVGCEPLGPSGQPGWSGLIVAAAGKLVHIAGKDAEQ